MTRKLDRGDIQDRLPDYVQGTLSESERAQVRAAVAADPELAAELEVVRAVRAALVEPRAAHVDVDAVLARLPRSAPPVVRARPVARWRIAAAIATIAVGGASLAVVQASLGRGGVAPLEISGESASAASGSELSITFGYGVADLSPDELQQLVAELTAAGSVPEVEPQPRHIVPSTD